MSKLYPGINDLKTWCEQNGHMELLLEWHPTKNNGLCPVDFSKRSHKKVWWLGKCGHEWPATINSRTFLRSGCPYCSNQKVLIGFNDLTTICPEIAEEWHPTKNGNLLPTDFTKGSKTQVWWLGKCGHEWLATVNSRTSRGDGCPICANKQVLIGFNDLATICPEIAEEWHPTKNGNLLPTDFTKGSSKTIWWLGKCGHEWSASINSRTGSAHSCPICSGHQVLSGFNDLQINYPEIAAEWHPIKNGNLLSTDFTKGSSKKAWWLGKCGHEWLASINSRTGRGEGCPVCANKQVLTGFNDLQTKYPEIAKEWHPTKNGVLTPENVIASTPKKVWWLGKCGHEWQAQILSRTVQGSGCPKCNRELHTSFPEQAIFYYIKQYYPDAINGDKKTIGMELDIYIPSCRIAIEYDGVAWHKNRKTDVRKNKICKSSNILLIRVQEPGIPSYDDCFCIKRKDECSKEDLSLTIQQLFYDIDNKLKVDIDVVRDEIKILNLYVLKKKTTSLATVYPEIAEEWHLTKNGLLTPDKVTSRSAYTVWWLGKCGHEWQAPIVNRTSKGFGCPYCSGQQVLIGFNDLQTKYPEIAAEWHPTKNDTLLPTDFTKGSSKKVWWLGKCGHEWQATIINRAVGRGCPYCSNNRILVGFNDLQSQYPEIAEEWHPIKNGNLRPTDFTKGSSKKVWWLGKCGHEWPAQILSRTSSGTGCPICSNKQVLIGFNDLATTCPEITTEWHPTKNGLLTPKDVTAGATNKVWWLGKCGHEWSAKVVSRTFYNNGCPVCGKTFGVSVQCIETGKIYSSLSKAQQDTGINKQCIIHCCKGRHQTAGGYHWKYTA